MKHNIKKFLTLCLFIIFATGCSATYSINIDEEVSENLDVESFGIYDIELLNSNEYIYMPARTDQNINPYEDNPQEGVEYYNYTLDSEKLNYNYNYFIDNYDLSYILSNAYMIHELTEDKNSIKLTTGDEFYLFDSYDDLNEVTVKITSKYKLVETNADEIDGNTYIWYIKRSTWRDEKIELILDKRGFIFNNFAIAILMFTLLVIGCIIYLVVRKKQKKNNKI